MTANKRGNGMFGLRGHDRALELADMSASQKRRHVAALQIKP